MTAHVHAGNMALYLEDARETETPWERWEYHSQINHNWKKLCTNPAWDTTCSYRRKIIPKAKTKMWQVVEKREPTSNPIITSMFYTSIEKFLLATKCNKEDYYLLFLAPWTEIEVED